MEPQAECMLVILGATPEGKKELVGFQVGLRESAQSWREQRWSWFFDQFAAGLSYSFGFTSGGNFQVRGPATIGLVRRQQPMR